MLEEAQARLKKEKITTQEQLWGLNSLYILLDFHKDDFCKIIDAVGLDTLLNKQKQYDRLNQAVQELAAKARLEKLEIGTSTLKP